MLDSGWLRRSEIEAHSVDMRQFVDFRQAVLTDGQRVIEAYNAAGLSYTVLPDRGLDIWTAHYRGVPLTWIAQGSPFLPGQFPNWLREFNGGLLTTCGLTHAGPPSANPITDGGRDLHGLYTRLRAYEVAVTGGWQAESYVTELSGTVSENKLFSEQLRLERVYRLAHDQPVIEWADRVINRGDTPAPLMVLYHINLGYPLIRAGTRLATAHEAVYSRDAEARTGYQRWPEYDAPVARYAEQVYFHHVKTIGQGWTTAALLQDTFGMKFEYDAAALPYLTQWKNVRQGIYVCGVEPGNCLPEGQVAAQEKGRLVMLQPGEERRFAVRLTVLDGSDAVQQCRAEIDTLHQSGTPVTGCRLDDYAG